MSIARNKNGDTEVSPFLTVRFNWNYPARFVTCKSTEYLYFGKPPGSMGWKRDLESEPQSQDQEMKMATPKCRHFQPRGFWNYPACFVTGKSTEYLYFGKPPGLMGWKRDLEPPASRAATWRRWASADMKMVAPRCHHFTLQGV